MTYNVFSGTLNPAHFTSLLYHLCFPQLSVLQIGSVSCVINGYVMVMLRYVIIYTSSNVNRAMETRRHRQPQGCR